MDQLKALENIVQKLVEEGLKASIWNSLFGCKETDYIGLWVSKDGIRPLLSKVHSVNTIDAPTKVCCVRWFIGIVNYYRDMWRKHAHTLASLTHLCSTKVKFQWTDLEKNAIMETNKIVGRDVLLLYPNLIKILSLTWMLAKHRLGD